MKKAWPLTATEIMLEQEISNEVKRRMRIMNDFTNGLKRLRSSEGFLAIGFIPEDMWGQELDARMKFAKELLKKIEEINTKIEV